jgi:hypothetical protein
MYQRRGATKKPAGTGGVPGCRDADMSHLNATVQACVDGLCEQGCSRVNACIIALQNGEEIPEVAGMSAVDRQAVLQELVSIMAVYDGSCES